ncbi:MAG: hypothetical protein WC779_08310, partial [Candidatus Omnitrophota bacterium]
MRANMEADAIIRKAGMLPLTVLIFALGFASCVLAQEEEKEAVPAEAVVEVITAEEGVPAATEKVKR